MKWLNGHLILCTNPYHEVSQDPARPFIHTEHGAQMLSHPRGNMKGIAPQSQEQGTLGFCGWEIEPTLKIAMASLIRTS